MTPPRHEPRLEYESATHRPRWCLRSTARGTLLLLAVLIVAMGVRETTEEVRLLRRIRQDQSIVVPQIVELPTEEEQKREVMKSIFVALAGVAGIVIILLVRPDRDESPAAGQSDS